jgi:hypothetical protein
MRRSQELEELPEQLEPDARRPSPRAAGAALAFALRARRAEEGDDAASWARMQAEEPELARAVEKLVAGFDAPRGVTLAHRALRRCPDPVLRAGVRAILRRYADDGEDEPTLALAGRLLAPALGEGELLFLDPPLGLEPARLAAHVARAAPAAGATRLALASEVDERQQRLFPEEVNEDALRLVTCALLGAPATVLPRSPLARHRAVYVAATLRAPATSRLEAAVRAYDALLSPGRAVVLLPTTGPLSDQRSLDDRRELLASGAIAAIVELPVIGRGIAPTLLVLVRGAARAGVLFVRPDEEGSEEPRPADVERFVAFAARAFEAHLAGGRIEPEPGVLAAVIPPETLDTSRALLTPARWLRPSAPSIAEASDALAAAEREEREASARVERALAALAALR